MTKLLALIVLAFLTWLLWPRERWTRDSCFRLVPDPYLEDLIR